MAITMLPTLMPWAPNNGWEYCPGSIISSKPRLHHSRPIVAHERRHFSVVSHKTLQVNTRQHNKEALPSC